MKGMLTTLDPSLEEQVDRKVRHLYDVFAKLAKTENELEDAGFFSKRKVQSKLESAESELEEDFMRLIRDFAELFRKTHREVTNMVPTIKEIKPEDAEALGAVSVPTIGAGDFKDAALLYEFADAFTKKYTSLHQDLARDTKDLLDENKRIVETYERHITIDRSEVATTVSVDGVTSLSIPDILSLLKKLRAERTYLDGRKDEVSRMLSVSLMSDIESLQASVETATRLGLDLPMDFSQKLRELARDASKATTLTTLLSLESQLDTARLQVANMLRDRIINMKHDVTSKIVEGGIPTSSNVVPESPVFSVEDEDVASLLSSYQKMVEWEGQVKIALKDQVEEVLDEVDKAADVPDDTGIKDIASVRKFVSSSRKELEKSDIDDMIKIYLKAKSIRDDAKQKLTEKIRNYLARFNELATSADRVLDYAQLSKKAPKVEDLEGSIVYLLESLNNLRNAVESGVSTFRDACKQEVNAIIEDLQTIKPDYAEIFMPIIVDLEDGATNLDKKDEFGSLRSEMRTIKDSILVKAKDSLENLRYRLRVKIRLAAAKLMGAGVTIPPEVQEAISELNNIGVAAETVFSLPAIARKMIEIYEKKISSEVIDLLMENVDDLEMSFEKAESIGVEVSKELEVLRKIKSEPPRELEAAADNFDRLANLTTSQELHKKIRNRVDEAYAQIKDAIHLFEEEGMSEFVQRLNTLVEQVAA
jgi:tryptophanyl-tRNA synthetase